MTHKRRKRDPLPPVIAHAPQDQQSAPQDAASDPQQLAMSQQSPDIPEHVWAVLREAGEEAANRLLQILQSPRFPTLRGSEQRALIALAFDRAYGLPVRRSLSVNLSSDNSDAIAASLHSLQDALPERAQDGPEGRTSHPSGPDIPGKPH